MSKFTRMSTYKNYFAELSSTFCFYSSGKKISHRVRIKHVEELATDNAYFSMEAQGFPCSLKDTDILILQVEWYCNNELLQYIQKDSD